MSDMAVIPPDPVVVLCNPDMDSYNSLAFHRNQRLLAGTLKGTAQLWDLHTNRCSLVFEVGDNPVTSMHHSEENLITQEKGGTLKYWSVTNTGYVLEKTTETDHTAFCRTDYDPELETLIFPESDNSIGLIHTKDWEVQTLLVPDTHTNLGQLACLKQLNWNGQNMILAGYESGDFLTWDVRARKIINESRFDIGAATSVDFDVWSNRGIVGGTEDMLVAVTYRMPAMELITLHDIPIKNPGINCIRIREDRKVFTTAGWDGRIRMFSWKTLKALAVLTEHKSGGVMDVAYSEGKVYYWNSQIMAAAGMDGQISLWSLYN